MVCQTPLPDHALGGHGELAILDASLVQFARTIIRRRAARESVLPDVLFGEGAWNMLLDLFVQTANERSVSVTSLCISSGSPNTTALRYIQLLIEHGLISKASHPTDKRSSNVKLTFQGLEKTVVALQRMMAIEDAEARTPFYVIGNESVRDFLKLASSNDRSKK